MGTGQEENVPRVVGDTPRPPRSRAGGFPHVLMALGNVWDSQGSPLLVVLTWEEPEAGSPSAALGPSYGQGGVERQGRLSEPEEATTPCSAWGASTPPTEADEGG